MASINFEFLREEEDGDRKEDDADKGQGDDEPAGDQEMEGQDEFLLTPTQRLDRYIHSENAFERQMVARTLLDGLRESLHDREQTEGMLDHMSRLSNDQEPMVRAELMEQIPHIAMLCHMNNSVVPRVVPERILPILVNYLRDNNNQVRKTSQAALLVLLEQGLLDNADVNCQVCPILEELTAFESVDDFRTEAVALMTRMASFLGPDVTENFFLPRFASLCSDSLFHVRKVCAANIGDMCSVVGRGATEEFLLPKFFYLCEDGVWGVRKACAECYMTVSSACSQGKRQSDLAPMFVQLLCDQSRWVRMAAFQQLGPFISTFADAEEKISENEDSSCLLSESAVDDASKTPSQSAQVGEKDESGAVAKEEKVEEAEEAGKALSTEGKGSDASSIPSPTESKLAELHRLATEVGELIDDADYRLVDGGHVLKTLVVTNSALKDQCHTKDPTSTTTTTTTATMVATTTTTSAAPTLGPESGAMMTETTADNCDLTPVPMEIEESTVGLSGDTSVTATTSAATPEVVSTTEKITTTSELQFDSNDDISAEERRMRKQYWLGPDVAPTDAAAAAASTSAVTAVTPSATENLVAAVAVDETAKTNAAAVVAAIKEPEESTASTAVTVAAPNCVTATLTVPCGDALPATSTMTESVAARSDEGCSRLSATAASLSEAAPSSGSAGDSSNPVISTVVTAADTSAVTSSAVVSATATAPSESYDHFNYWYIPPPVLDDHLLPTLALGPSSSASASAAAGSSTEAKTAANGDLVGKVSKGMEALEIGEKTREEQELEISQSFEIPPLAMSSPDKEASVDSRPSAEGASGSKNDVDVEMAEDDPVTNLFGDDEDGEPPLLLVSGKDEDGLTTRRGGSIGSYLDPLVEFTEEERRFQEQQLSQQQQQQPTQQNVIPSDLLNYFLSMADPAKVQTVDTELTRHCAFSLPAVALTLGRKNWGCIRDIYETLASDMQWKVRYTLACSFHEMARIMGQEITSQDLLPIFDGFLKDLDEVRIGILKHLADFFELLLPKERKVYLQRIRDFMNCDNQRNWRFRLELANQLSPLACLFEPQDVADHLLPIAFQLAFDRVAKVRLSSFRAMCACAKTFEFGIPSADVGVASPTSCTSTSPTRSVPIPGNEALVKSFLSSLVTRLATSSKWLDRQAFTIVSGLLLAQEAITQQHFDEYLLLPLCQLQSDSVANVRLTLARSLASHVLTKPLFNSEENRSKCIYGQDLHQTIETLKKDDDVDVRFCADGGSKDTESFDLRAFSDDEGDQFMSAEYH